MHGVFDLCISCKACKTECPSGVDVAKMKIEFLANYNSAHGISVRDRLFAYVHETSRIASPIAPLANLISNNRVARLVLSKLGIHPNRSLPLLSNEKFTDWFKNRPFHTQNNSGRQVVYFHDTWVSYYQPEVGIAAVRLLEAAGFEVMKGKMPTMQDTKHIEPVLKKAGSGNVSGYACTKYEVYKDSEKVRDLCVTSWSNIEAGSEIQSTLLKMANFMEDLTKSLSSGPNFGGSTADFEKSVFKQISKLNGFPVQTIDYSNGSVTGITTFKSSKKTSLDSSAFEPPAGYEKQEMDMQ